MKSSRGSSRVPGQITDLSLVAQQTYWNYVENEAQWLYNLKRNYDSAAEVFNKLKAKARGLPAAAQEKFWSFIENQIKFIIKQDSAVFYEVLSHTSPNPLGNPTVVEGVEGLGITMRALRVLLIPFQKGLQYYYWKNPKPGFEVEKPEFTRKDAIYLGLDITLLALTIAAFAAGAEIPAAAIALSAAVITATVAGVQYGRSLYEVHQLKKEKSQVDALRDKLHENPHAELSIKETELLNNQISKATLEHGKPCNDAIASLDLRSSTLGERIKTSITNRYQNVRRALGFGLTMMAIVSASLILAGVILGPVGVPLIMAGVGLSMTTAAIAGGMMIANYIKRKRNSKQAEADEVNKNEIELDNIEQKNKSPMHDSTRLITDRTATNDREIYIETTQTEHNQAVPKLDHLLSNPLHSAPSAYINKSSLFSKAPANDQTIGDAIEMQEKSNSHSKSQK